MSGKGYCNSVIRPNKSDKGLNRCEVRVDRTCPVQELDMSGNAYWNPAMDLDKSERLERIEWPRHSQKSLLEPGQETRYVWFFLASWIRRCF
jgi:hypothetical protein